VSEIYIAWQSNRWTVLNGNKKSDLMLRRCARAYSSSCSR